VISSQKFPIGEERGDRTVQREQGPDHFNPAFSLVERTGRRDLEMRQSQSSISGNPGRPCVWIPSHLLLVVPELLAIQNREFEPFLCTSTKPKKIERIMDADRQLKNHYFWVIQTPWQCFCIRTYVVISLQHKI
jgi:hypothetical protein